jgi:hypothetical protein
VPEHSRWDETDCGLCKPSEGAPDKVSGAQHARERSTERRILADRAITVEDHQAHVLLRHFDETLPHTWIAQHLLEVVGPETAADVDRACP